MAPFTLTSTDTEILQEFKSQAQGKTFLITGPSPQGIGSQIALSLLTNTTPTLLLLAGRNKSKCLPVIQELTQINPGVKVEFVDLDFLSRESISAAVVRIKDIIGQVDFSGKIDFLINNAGVMGTREFIAVEGVESQFQGNYLGPWLFTNLLVQGDVLGRGGVVVGVGSLGYQMDDVHFEDVNYKNGEDYNGWRAYGQSKSAQLLGTRGLGKRLEGKGIAVLIAHPGVTLESQLLVNSAIDQEYFGQAYAIAIERNNGNPLPPQNMVSLQQCAGVVLYTALNPELRDQPGAFIVENEIYKETREYANNDVDVDRLWELSEKIVGEKFEF